jgi:hypothetical protein
MNFQIYKLTDDKWSKVEIEKVKEGDILKVFDLDNGGYLLNAEKGVTSICTKSAWKDKSNAWNIQSMPYKIERSEGNE